jgi:Protein of unknown function (DUF3617)
MTRRANHRVHVILLCMAALAAVVAPAARAEERIRAGQWEMTTTQDGKQINSGMSCITPEMAASSNTDQPAMRALLETSWAKANCTLTALAATANTVSYTVDCAPGPGAKTITSASKYHGGTFETELTTTRNGTTTSTVTKGRYIGSCP